MNFQNKWDIFVSHCLNNSIIFLNIIQHVSIVINTLLIVKDNIQGKTGPNNKLYSNDIDALF